jgi:hypothetical protein
MQINILFGFETLILLKLIFNILIYKSNKNISIYYTKI